MDFLTLAKKRYSCRKYTKQPVDKAQLTAILEAGHVAPTAANRQSQRIVVVQSEEGMEKLSHCTRLYNAPCALIVCSDRSEAWVRPYDKKDYNDIDAAIVATHMMLCAASLGLDSVWVAMFDPAILHKEFNLPEKWVPISLLMIGHGDGAPADPDRHSKLRKPLSETVFFEHI